MKYIADRGMTATKVIAIIAALGVIGSGIYGMTQAGPHLVTQTVSTVDNLKVTVMTGLDMSHVPCTVHNIHEHMCALA